MDPLSANLDLDQSFSSLLKVELAKQHSYLELNDSVSLNHTQTNRLIEDAEIPESTTHYIKVYREQLETLQKDNFSLKLQLYYFQRAFESAGISDLPQVAECKEDFQELEKELVRNRSSLTGANDIISQLKYQNNELQKKLVKFERKSNVNREKLDEITTKFKEKEDAFNELNYLYCEILNRNGQYEQRCDELINQITNLENEVTTLNGKSVAQTEKNLGHVHNLSEAEKDLKTLQAKNSKIIEFAKPLAQKLQETQEELEKSDQKCDDLRVELLSAHNSIEQSRKECLDLEEQLCILEDSNNVISKQSSDLSNAKLYSERLMYEHTAENTSLMCKLKNYEDIIENLNNQIAQFTPVIETLRTGEVVKERKIAELSRDAELVIQSKFVISNLENKISELMQDIHSLQQVNLDKNLLQEITSLSEKLSKKQSENESLCNEIKAQSYLLQNEVKNNNDLKLIAANLKEEVYAFRALKTLDGCSQTVSSQDNIDSFVVINQNKHQSEEISKLLQKIFHLESENECLLNKNENLPSIESKMIQLDQQNDELKQQIKRIQYSHSCKNELDIANIKSNQMSARLNMVETLSKASDILQLGFDSENIQSALTDVVDQLSVAKGLLTSSLSNEEQLQLHLTLLEENYKSLLAEKSNVIGQVSESEKKISELTNELNVTKSSFQSKLEFAHQHINELQSILISNTDVSFSLQKNKFSRSIAESESSFENQNIPKHYFSTMIPRSSSTPCIREKLSTSIYTKDIRILPDNDSGLTSDENIGHIPDAIVPDKESLKKALQTGSSNLSLLLSIYKELLTTQKYLSRAKRYTLDSQYSRSK